MVHRGSARVGLWNDLEDGLFGAGSGEREEKYGLFFMYSMGIWVIVSCGRVLLPLVLISFFCLYHDSVESLGWDRTYKTFSKPLPSCLLCREVQAVHA